MNERIQADLRCAMFARDNNWVTLLRSFLTAYRNEAIAKGLN